MRVAVVGGNLQGVEATYLCRKAGWEVTVFDKRPDPPAKGLCHRFMQHHISEESLPAVFLKGFDAVLPALEDSKALGLLIQWCDKARIPLAFDPHHHRTTKNVPGKS